MSNYNHVRSVVANLQDEVSALHAKLESANSHMQVRNSLELYLSDIEYHVDLLIRVLKNDVEITIELLTNKERFLAGQTFRYNGDDWHLDEIDGDMEWLKDEEGKIRAQITDVSEMGFIAKIHVLKYSHKEEVSFSDIQWLEKEVQ
ncbi:MAG: hypothetical protein H7Y13_12005 [Sphingobacteriaceae bacterium]|nr:hypothetical protein [Sphingobacteriaceae bacterium]